MMKKILFAATIVLTAVLGTACATSGETKSAGTATAAIAAAKEAQAKAHAVGHEFTGVSKMIKKAEKLAAEGKADEAIKLAEKAKFEAEAGVQQYEDQKDAGPRF